MDLNTTETTPEDADWETPFSVKRNAPEAPAPTAPAAPDGMEAWFAQQDAMATEAMATLGITTVTQAGS